MALLIIVVLLILGVVLCLIFAVESPEKEKIPEGQGLLKTEFNVRRLPIKFVKGAETLKLENNLDCYASRSNDVFSIYKRSSDINPVFQCRLNEVKGFIKVSELKRKNVSVGKAVVGGMLFGPAGAILGGIMGKKEEDEQYLLVISKNGLEYALIFDKSQYLNINKLLPGKEVYSMNSLESKSFYSSELSTTEELEKLLALKEKGALTEEEFNQQKQKLLN